MRISHDLIFAFTQQLVNRRVVLLTFDLAIHSSEVKPKLPQMLRLELAALEPNHYVAVQYKMIVSTSPILRQT